MLSLVRLHFAFGNKVAKIDTTTLNRWATYAFALPIRNTALVSMGTLSSTRYTLSPVH